MKLELAANSWPADITWQVVFSDPGKEGTTQKSSRALSIPDQ
jgi:hypothetical protein